MCRSQVKVILRIGASLSTYLCTHYMYVHMARCHDCTYIWVDACLYKLFLHNLSCLHRLVHVSLSVRSSIATRFLKLKLQFAIGKLKKRSHSNLIGHLLADGTRDELWVRLEMQLGPENLVMTETIYQNKNERGPKLQKQPEEPLPH